MAATFATQSNQTAALKELYTGDDYMKDLVYARNPFLALVPKNESPSGFAGKYIPVPMTYVNSQGRSATFSNAQTNQTPALQASFFVYRTANYSLATITNDMLEATKDDAGAFLDEGKYQVDQAIKSLSNDIALELFSDGTGSRGQIGSIVEAASVATITLLDAQTVVNFEVGMTLVASTTAGGVTSDDTVVLTSINRATGVLVGSTDGSLDTEWAANSFIAVQGDVATAGSTSTGTNAGTGFLKMVGLAGWLPINGPASNDSFWNVNRSVDATRLAGVPYNGSAQSIEEALIDHTALLAREGAAPDYCFTNFATWAALEKEVGAKVQYVNVKHDTAEIAFKGITINAPYGPVTVIADRSCPAKRGFLLELDTWKLRTLGKCPHILTYGREGLEGIRVSNSDALEVRVARYGNLICSAPGYNGQIQFSA